MVCTANDKPRWLEARRYGLGSSDGADVLNVGYGSRMACYASKVLGPKPWDDDPKKRAGRVLEKAIAEIAQIELGTGPARVFQLLLRSKRWPLLTCTPDFLVEAPRLGLVMEETKNTTESEEWEDDRPCRRNWIQCQHQLAVTGQRFMLLVGLLWGYKLVPIVIERDDKWIEGTYVPALEEFWSLVRARKIPGPDPSESCRRALVELFPEHAPGLTVDLPDLADQPYAFAHEEVERLTAAIGLYQNDIRARMQEAETAFLSDGTRWTYKTNKKGVRTLRRWPVKTKDAATAPQEESAA